MKSIYDFEATQMNGQALALATLRGQVMLIVNTASACGFTPQFGGLEKIHQAYKDQGLAVLGFPCNQFGSQDPGSNESIASFCQLNYGVSFPMMEKNQGERPRCAPPLPMVVRRSTRFVGQQGYQVEFHQVLDWPRWPRAQTLCAHGQAREHWQRH